ncbi:MAG: SixA phosphatase family protein [Ilyomonas sp.]
MKSLLLIRHAKSSWDNFLLQDIQRPLNERGLKDSPAMAKRLLNRSVYIDTFISSPAKRAFDTCCYFINAYGENEKDILIKPELYLPPIEAFYEVIENLVDDCSSIAVFSHNPGITDFANELTSVHIDNMPTCSIYAIKVNLKKWKDFESADKKFWFFDYPKKGS